MFGNKVIRLGIIGAANSNGIRPTIGAFTVAQHNYGAAPFVLTPPSSNSNGTWSYSSSNTNVITINNNIATIVGVGNATITATQAPFGNYTYATATSNTVVNTVAPTIGVFNVPSETAGSGSFILNQPSSNSAGAWSYSSSDTNIMTINGNVATPISAGNVTIIAIQAANGNYTGGVTSANATVNTNIVDAVTLTVNSNIKNLNVYNAITGSVPSGVTRTGTYSPGSTINVVVNSGIVIGSTSASVYAFDTGSGWDNSDTLSLTNNGYIAGMGGAGGAINSGNATSGGPSMHIQKAISITNSGGYIYSGGGGGSGGGEGTTEYGGGGGGGAGSPGGIVDATVAQPGRLLSGGSAGGPSNSGGGVAGGHLGQNGVNGIGGHSHGADSAGGGGGGGGGGGASGGKGGSAGSFDSRWNPGGILGGHGKAITGIANVTWISGSTRVYGGTV